jgi:hypothetical protein
MEEYGCLTLLRNIDVV